MPDSQRVAAHYDAFYTAGDFAKPPRRQGMRLGIVRVAENRAAG